MLIAAIAPATLGSMKKDGVGSQHEKAHRVKGLWVITGLMVGCGAVLVLGSAMAGLGPVALVCGVLLVWSGIVKVVVLRIWRATLSSAPLPEPTRATMRIPRVWSGQR
jgi:hypothetical protein